MREAEDSRFITKTLSPEAFERIYKRYEDQVKNLNNELENVEFDKSQRIRIIENILRMAENIGETYSNANPFQKKHYIGLFFNKFIVEKGKIVEWELSELVKSLVEEGSVRVESNWLLRQDSASQYPIWHRGAHWNPRQTLSFAKRLSGIPWLPRQDSNLDQLVNSQLRYLYATEN